MPEGGDRRMKKVVLALAVALMAVAMLTTPVFAAKPAVVEDVWFVIPVFVSSTPAGGPISFVADKVWASSDGTVMHSRGTTISTYIARSPPGAAGTVRIGTVTAVSDFVFDTVSETGTLNMKITLTLTTSNNAQYPNPYGVGTLEGTLVADVTSLNPYASIPLPGDAQGRFVATHGTGAFENAKLEADVTLSPGTAVTPTMTLGIEYLFFGHHINHLYNEGTLTYHNPGK